MPSQWRWVFHCVARLEHAGTSGAPGRGYAAATSAALSRKAAHAGQVGSTERKKRMS